jgi:hypothetical protein
MKGLDEPTVTNGFILLSLARQSRDFSDILLKRATNPQMIKSVFGDTSRRGRLSSLMPGRQEKDRLMTT